MLAGLPRAIAVGATAADGAWLLDARGPRFGSYLLVGVEIAVTRRWSAERKKPLLADAPPRPDPTRCVLRPRRFADDAARRAARARLPRDSRAAQLRERHMTPSVRPAGCGRGGGGAARRGRPAAARVRLHLGGVWGGVAGCVCGCGEEGGGSPSVSGWGEEGGGSPRGCGRLARRMRPDRLLSSRSHGDDSSSLSGAVGVVVVLFLLRGAPEPSPSHVRVARE